jgi:hypothetical protein
MFANCRICRNIWQSSGDMLDRNTLRQIDYNAETISFTFLLIYECKGKKNLYTPHFFLHILF